MRKTLLLAGIVLLCLATLAAQKTAPKQNPAIGIRAGYFTGAPRFKNLESTSFESYSGISYGLFTRLHVYNGYFLQPEFNLLKREIRGTFTYANGDETGLSLDQQVKDIGLIVFKAFGKGAIRPFAAVGMSIAFFDEKTARPIFDPATSLTYQLDFRSNDTNGILEAGAEIKLPWKLALSLAGRFYLAGNNIRFYNAHSASLNRWHLNTALVKYF